MTEMTNVLHHATGAASGRPIPEPQARSFRRALPRTCWTGRAHGAYGGSPILIADSAMPTPGSPPRRIVLIGYPGAQSLDLVGPLEVFSMANRHGAAGAYEVVLASEDGGEIVCNSGLRLGGAVALADLPGEIDTILISGGDEPATYQVRGGALPAWFAARRGKTRRIGSVCSGSFVLAAAGLLDGRRATTHWGFCEEFRAFRPEVKLEPDAIFVADPPFYTSAGVTAGIDLCLALVEADHGAQVALAVARNMVSSSRGPADRRNTART